MTAAEVFLTLPTTLPTTLEECLKIPAYRACLAAILKAQGLKGTGSSGERRMVALLVAASNLEENRAAADTDPEITAQVYQTSHLLFELARQGVQTAKDPAKYWGDRADVAGYTRRFLEGTILRPDFYDRDRDGATQRSAFRILGFGAKKPPIPPTTRGPSKPLWASAGPYGAVT